MGKRVVVAIDGPAGAGKSTVARRVAERLGFLYLDTGAMYRAVALWALQTGVELSDMHRLEQLALFASIDFADGGKRVRLNGEDVSEAIRTPEIAEAASQVSKVPGVRRAMVAKQRAMSEGTSVVMEGRDIGSVVFPEAEVKIYLDADPEVRAERRIRELELKGGVTPEAEQVAAEMRQRDDRDRSRADAPLRQAPDAVRLDTSGLDLEEVEEAILRIVREKMTNGKEFKR